MSKPWYTVENKKTGKQVMVPPGHYTLDHPGWVVKRAKRKPKDDK